MNKVYINGRFLTQKVTGVQRYAIEVVRGIDDLLGRFGKGKYEVIILIPNQKINEQNFKNISLKKVGSHKGHFWEQFDLPLNSKDGVLLNLCNLAPILKKNKIVTIHDASVFALKNNFSKLFTFYYKTMLRLISKTSKKIITDSEFSLKEIQKYLKVSSNLLRKIYLGKEHFEGVSPNLTILRRIRKPYVLAVSSLSPHKNFQGIIKALKFIENKDFELVIVGGMNETIFKNNGIELSNRINFLGYISDEELKALYQYASCFIYPSFYEGFGLPPLEAMVCGCPVIVSKTASLPEVCGDAVLYCNPIEPKSIASQITKVLNDKKLKLQLAEKSLIQSAKFSWEKCAEQVLLLVEEVISQ